MTKKQREYKQALATFNRAAGQLKRRHDIDPETYLSGKTTARGVEKALEKMRFDAEQEDIAKRVAAYEEKLDKIYEEMLKQESIEQFEEERDQARDTLNERYGLDWDEDDYEDFWDTFGDKQLIDTYGSDQIIYIGERFMKEGASLRPSKVAKIAKRSINEIMDQGLNQQQAVDYLNMKLQKELKRKANKKEKK